MVNFEEYPKQQKTIIRNALNAMRKDQYDVREFNFG